MTSITLIITCLSLVEVKCNSGLACAKERLIQPVAREVCTSMVNPILDTLKSHSASLEIVIEMIKLSNPDKPDLYEIALERINDPGKFPHKEY